MEKEGERDGGEAWRERERGIGERHEGRGREGWGRGMEGEGERYVG
jgi:hypothetical protein